MNLLVVWPISIHMCKAVHAPHDIDTAGVSQDGGDEEGVGEGLAPEVHWDYSGQHEAEDRHYLHIVPETDFE